MSAPSSLTTQGHHAAAFAELLERVRRQPSYRELCGLVRLRETLGGAGFRPDEAHAPLRIAIGGPATTTYLAPIFSLLMESYGIAPTIHQAAFGSVEAEILREDSDLARFQPRLLILVQTPLAITDWPPDTAGEESAGRFAEARVTQLLGLCRAAHERLGCDVIVDNWHQLPGRPHGSGARRMAGDRNALLRRMNGLLERDAPPYVQIHDVDGLATLHGLAKWLDLRFWYQAKQAISFEMIGAYLTGLASAAAAVFRAPVKCVVLDLDNTLWGGVIGDDGVSGIRIRQGDPEGEAFQAFQRYLLRLKHRGMLLAACSKNEIGIARAPFAELPDMVLKLADFVAFKANWEPKPSNLRAIAGELNIGLEAMAFIDDNPVERALVRTALPAVRVVDLPEDPADYPAALDRSGLFEVSRVSAEDLARTDQYHADALRAELATSLEDYGSYLRSLRQQACIRAFEPSQSDRIAQLVNKTNQFNLLTVRTTRSEVEQLAARVDILTATVRLIDRFGDNGLIAVWYGAIHGGRLTVLNWVMSCRVFNRGVEEALMNHIVGLSRMHGVREILGEYRPTEKNGLVRDLYPRLGFQMTASPGGTSKDSESWLLDVAGYQSREHTIVVQAEPPP